MIEHIEIKNFKSIKSKYFPLRNLNILLGMNGQGKSTFVQALLTVRQSNVTPGLAKGWLSLRGNYCDIGTTKDAFYQYNNKKELEFNLKCKPDVELSLKYEYEIEKDALPLQNENEIDIEAKINEASKATGLFSDNFEYLSAYRIDPRSTYPKNNSTVVRKRNIGINGEYSVHYIETFYDDEISFENVLHPQSRIKDSIRKVEIVDKTLINQINLWLGEISPGINIRTSTVNQDEVLLEYTYQQPTYGQTNRFKPENVGFGITYALPVITALLKAKPGELVIIENPESHIHPRGQAELGKLIALVAQNDVQIIIETHSDHIVNGIRVGVKQNLLDKEKVILFYFQKIVEDLEQFSSITNIELDDNGTLSEEPEGLLDEWGNQLLKLL